MDQEALKLIDASPIASIITNPRLADNPIVASNEEFSELTGFGMSEIIGRNCRFLAGEATQPWLTEKIRESVRRKEPVLVEILNYKKSGSVFLNAVLVAPIFGDEGSLDYFLGSQVDIGQGEPTLAIARRMHAIEMVKTLTPRQLQVMTYIAKGFLNKQIADELDLTERTVKMHRSMLMERLKLKSIADLIRLAVEAGM